ncbi:hypothetical protein HMPREF2811_04390 [Globicatella sp. HMSC072A10]|uniref:heavy-metal-associated domain-containing protein n=1 Tax=Globicatella sp. HMSC072A10 TaxID=1739315 RepID=UPI0008B6A5E4|nr:copper ion binding protein [Globicatella sp. HMSC072A10]OFK59581.1 hypothetical protein HMPREF2811_04390 [Globicatella sp. HMSC072A10]
MKKEFAIEGMGCQHCVHSIEKALTELEGVHHVDVSLEKNNAIIEYDKSLLTEKDLQRTVDEAGYDLIL